MSRKITVVLEIEDQDSAKEFWDAHVGCRNIHGCRVIALADGDVLSDPLGFDLANEVRDDEEEIWIY